MVQEIVRKINKNIKDNQQKVLLLVVIYFLLSTLSGMPYFNTVLNPTSLLFVVLFLSLIIFRFKEKFYFSLALIFFALSIFAALIKDGKFAELFGNVTYGVLFLAFIMSFYNYLKKIRLKK